MSCVCASESAGPTLSLRADEGMELTVRIEVETTSKTGFGDGEVRAVSENGKMPKFDQSGFEES